MYDLHHEVEEGKERLDPLSTGYDLLARSVAEQARDIDRLKSDHALRDPEINRLRSSISASFEESALLMAGWDLILRDRDASLAHLMEFFVGIATVGGTCVR